MSALDFRNTRSRAMAKKDLTDQLTQVDGVWQHKSGTSIADAVQAYAADTENKFLFKAKTNKGGGTNQDDNAAPNTGKETTSVLEMTSDQMLKAAAAGKFGSFNL